MLSDSLAKLELGTVTKCNFAGDGKTGASWTDNIMAQKSSQRDTVEIREQGDGAEDEEWVGQGDGCLWTWTLVGVLYIWDMVEVK